jgi:antitoxin (DNA-binding transcriptional repressor) of toxin-antitoxin stability system
MPSRIGIRELRDTLTATIRKVRAGETFEVTHDGEPVALLTPIPPGRLDRLLAAGDVTLPTRPYVPEPPSPVRGVMTATEALEQDRGD